MLYRRADITNTLKNTNELRYIKEEKLEVDLEYYTELVMAGPRV